VKPDPDTLLTVPTAPPAAGPDRALDPLPPDPDPWAKGTLLLVLLLVPVLLVPLLLALLLAVGVVPDPPEAAVTIP
jgi:hypothetical protein